MLFTRLFSAARLFSTSAVQSYPKLKSHSGTKKRWRSIASGAFKRVSLSNTVVFDIHSANVCLQAHAGHKHLNVSKNSARKNSLAQTAYSHGTQTAKLKKLLPYGSP